MNNQTTKLPNHQTSSGRKGQKERMGERKDGTMYHQTTKRPNYQTMLARWAAVAAVAAGVWLGFARDAEAASWVKWIGTDSGYWVDSDNNRWHRDSDGWDVRRPDLADGQWSTTGTRAATIVYFDNGDQTSMTVNNNGGAEFLLNQILFQNSSGRSFASAGDAYIKMSGSGAKIEAVDNKGTGTYTFNVPLTLAASTEFNPVAGNLTFNEAITMGANAINIYGYGDHTVTLGGDVTGTGAITLIQDDGWRSPKLLITGDCSTTGSITVNAGTLQVGDGGTTGTVSGNIVNNTAVVVDRSSAWSYSGTISGTGSLTKQGAGNLTLTGANSYQGGTTISAGTITINADSGLGNSSGSLTFSGSIACGLTVAASKGSQTLSSTRTVTLSSSKATTWQIGNGSSLTYSGNIGGTGAGTFTKTGAGTLTLGGANGFSAATSVKQGTLVLNGSMANSAVTVTKNNTSGTQTGTLEAGGSSKQIKSLAMDYGTLIVAPNKTFAAQNGKVNLTGGAVKFDTTGLDLTTTGSWTIASGTSAATCSGVTLQDASGTALTVANGWGIAASGNNVLVTYTPPVTEPTVETGAATGIGTGGATLSAMVTGNGGAALSSGGIVYSSTDDEPEVGADGCTAVAYGSVPTVDDEFDILIASGLTAGTKYYYRGYAVNSEDLTGYGDVEEFYTKCSTPGAPSGLTLTRNTQATKSMTVKWSTAATPGAGGGTVAYLVLHSTDPDASGGPVDGTVYSAGDSVGEGWTVAGVVTAQTSGEWKFTDSSLTPDTVYYYAIYAFQYVTGEAGTYAYSSTALEGSECTHTTLPATWTASFTEVPQGTSATISWTFTDSYTDYDGYVLVLRRSDSTKPANLDSGTIYHVDDVISTYSTVRYVGSETSVTLSGLTPETTYTYEVWRYKGDNYRSYRTGGNDSFTTTAKTGPDVMATGVSGTAALVNWSSVSGATTGYDVQSKTSGGTYANRLRVIYTNGFSSGEGWSSATYTSVQNVTLKGRVWTFGGSSGNAAGIYPASTQGDVTGYVYLQDSANSQYLTLPILTGPINTVKVRWRSAGGSRSISLYSLTGSSFGTETLLKSQTISTANTTDTLVYEASTPITVPVRFKIKKTAAATIYIDSVEVYGPQLGYSDALTGLTSGTTYLSHVRKNPAGDWSDDLSVKAGVVPNTPTATATRNSVTFTWTDAQSGAVAYRVDATVTDGTASRSFTCPDDKGLGTNDWSNGSATLDWKYTGTVKTTTGSSYLNAGPGYCSKNATSGTYTEYIGHYLVGNNTQAIESRAFELQGATAAQLTFKNGGWNMGSASTSLEVARVNVFYSLDGGDWCLLGSYVPPSLNDGHWNTQTINLPAGALDGDTLAIKITAPNGEFSSLLRGAAIKALSLTLTGASGKYGSTAGGSSAQYSLSGYPKTVNTASCTVSGLSASQDVHFRVQALQGDRDTPTAKSVWVEASSATTEFAGPAVEVTGTTRYSLTAGWPAYSGSDAANYDVSYRVQITGCANAGAGATTASECPAQNLDFGTGTGAWTYQRGKSGSTSSAYPKYEGSVHKVWGQYTSMSTYPGIESPAINLGGYASASVDFTHMYVNQTTYSEVALYYSLDSGSSWTLVTTTGEAGGYTIATGTSRSLALPPEALVDGVMVKLVALHATSYGVTTDGTTTYYARGASIYGLKVTARGAGGGDYTCDYASDVHTTTGTSYTFSEETIGSDAKLKGLTAGSNYYVRVQTVLTPKSGAPAGTTAATSDWAQAGAKTGDPQSPPESISATAIKQKSMTLVWPEADGATENTLYWVQASSCAGTAWNKTAVQPSSTTEDLGEGDDWHYVGGGTEVTSSQQTGGHITGRGVYPAYAAGSEKSQVLAGEGTPGIESIPFSTVGAGGGTLAFGHGRWYNAGALGTAELTATYSIDGGETWESIGTSAGRNAQEFVTDDGAEQTMSLPPGALGHASVIVRIEATTAAVVSGVPVGAAVGSATVTLTGNPGNYTGSGCKILDEDGLSYDQLTQALSGLNANTPYYFRVCASDGQTSTPQYGAWVDGMAKTLDVPATPDTPWAVNIGRHTMTIRWTEAERAETYTLEVSKSSSFPAGSTTTYTGITGTEQPVNGLDANTTYYFRVTGHSDGTSGSASSPGNAKTVTTMSITGLSVTDILETSLTVKWDAVSGDTYTLDWGPVSDEGLVSTAEEIPAPGSSLKRSDAGNGWSYFGGNGSYPAYWKGSTAGDEGHALIYATGGQPGIQSRWFSTFGVTNAVVDFYHGRFNSGADSTVVVTYSLDGGSTWSTAGTAESTAVSTPTEHRQIALPAEALGKRSVMVRLTASGASGNKGAHVKDLKVVLQSGKGAATRTGVSVSGGTYTLSAPSQSIAAGTRYWFKLTATEGGETAVAETTGATRTKTTGVLRSQGFEGGSGEGVLDTSAWAYSISYKNVSNGDDAGSKTAGTQRPVVEVVSGQNPLYGDRALRMSGSANADVFGVVDFDNLNSSALGSASANVTVTIPFAAQDLAQNDYLYVSYSTDNGTTWLAPGGTADLTSMGSVKMTRIGKGGGDVINRNWPYNRGTNSTTRPKGDAYTFDLTGISQLKLRVAFCGQSGGAARYYFIDEVTVSLNPSAPDPVSAAANSSGNVDLTWTPATGQGAVIIRGQDMRNPPSFTDLSSLPAGYEVVTNASGGVFFENATRAWTDTGAVSGNKYFYYFYGAVPASGGGYSLSKTPNSAETIIKGMVNAIASQGWDGWDVHPWGYRVGRVTNPGRSSDYGWWKEHGMNATTVAFKQNEYEIDTGSTSDGTNFVHSDVGNHKYADYYGTGAGASDADRYKQLGLTSVKSYIGGHSFRLSGGGSYLWSGDHVWVDYSGNTKTNSNVDINTNNAAIEFANVDLSGYKNVEFQMHFAGTNLNGGNDLHVAISTNGGTAGTWLEVGNDNAAGWRVVESHYDYGRAISDGDTRLSGNWDFYFEDSASATPYGNPYVLQVPDSVTQIMVRVMFYDSNGGSRRNASYFIDEVRLVGEVALETPHPIMTDISKTSFTATWDPIEGASSYNVKVTSVEATDKVKLTEAFALQAVPLQWKASASGVDFSTTASRSGKSGDYGLSLTAQNGWLASPEVGAANKVEFYVKASSSSAMTLALEASEDGETWELVKSFTASTVGTSWSKQTVELPRRQWEQIRFRKSNSTAGNWHIDDITIYGGGNYATTVTTRDGLTATSLTVSSGVSEGTEYFVSVQAYGAPNGVPTVSGWGETADYTPGTFTVKSDGFEMTRLGGTGSSSARLLVVAITDTDADYDDLPTPGVDTTVSEGTSLAGGKAVVVKNVDSTFSNFEHVWPHGSRTEPVEAKYVAFWKHGNYWEGRLETNVTLGTYVCQAADAFAYTNGTAMSATGAQTYLNGGKGWSGAWNVQDKPDWDAGAISQTGGATEGLLETNQLWGAGGNMIALYPGNTPNSKKVEVKRQLAAALPKNSEWWGMFTMKVTESGPNKWAGIQLLDSSGTSKVSIGKLWNAKDSSNNNEGKVIGFEGSKTKASDYVLNNGDQCVIVFKWDGSKMWLKTFWYENTSNPVWARTATFPGFDVSETLSMDDIHAIRLVAENSGSAYLDNVYFDEIRIGGSWEDLVGKDTEAPFPVTAAEAWTDGNELVRVSWTYADEGREGTIDRPLADGVRIYAREGTSGEWTEIYKGKGTNEAAVAAGGVSRWDHVVAPGSVHQYQVAAYSSGKSASAVDAVLKDSSPASYSVETGLYGETEYVNPFAYTNWAVASTAAGSRWLGGNGFGDNYWAPGSGSAGTWSIATPEEAQSAVHITNAVYGSRLAAGNVLKVVVGDGETASINRTLDGDAWYGKGGQTFYVAFRMAYQWGDNAGRQVGLRLTDDTGKYVQFGKAQGDGDGYQHRFGATGSQNGTDYSSGWSTAGDDMTGYGTASSVARAYLVVGKVNWSSDGRANLRGVKYVIGNDGSLATLPGSESEVSWEASYDNAAIGAIRKIELIAGTDSAGHGTIGTAWFDEIRFGPTWEDIVGATEPEDAWVDGISATVYLGDYAQWYMYGWPKGPKQSAWVSLATSTAFTTILATNGTTWVDNAPDRGKERTKWQGGEIQFTQTGTLYGGGSVKGELVTINSWTRTAANTEKWNTYTVDPLPVPTVDSAVGGTAKVTLRWTPATVSGRTFSEVMVVRYTGETVPAPVQGTTYTKGQTFGGGTVVYRGTAGNYVDKGLTKSTTYKYAFFTVNNSYYSTPAQASATTDANDPEIVIDGDPGDWVGLPSEVKNSSTLSSGEWIWTDKVLDGRVDKNGAYDADITEFRMKVDGNGYVNFMARLHCMTNRQNPYISVGIVTNVDATQLAVAGNEDGENWIGDESATFMGGNLFSPASLHYADIQMAVHWVTTAGENGVASGSGGWVVELYRKDGNSWFAPVQAWEAASSAGGEEDTDPCIEWKVKRSDLGLDYANVTPARFTVASFANAGGWNNDTEATVDLSSGTSHAVDTLSIAPWGVNDKNLSLGAWDEGIQKGNAEYWFDIWFGPTSLHNAAPNAPATYTLDGNPAVNGQKVSASPTMRWSACADHDDIGGTHGDLGFVVGYLVEVSTNEYFNGLEGTTENGPISCRVNVESVPGEAMMSYRFKTDSRYYWWRVRARDNSGALSAPTPWHYEVEGKTDNEGPVARLLFVGKDEDVARYVSDPAFRHEEDMSGDATSVLDSDLEDGGHTFGFVLEWYDVNGVFATNWFRASKDGEGDQWPKGSGKNPYDPSANYNPNVGDFAWSIQSHHGDGTPYGRVSPNWDLVIVDRSTVSHEDPGASKPAKPADETVGGVAKSYMWTNAMVLPTDDGGTETIWGWVIDCGLDHVFQPAQTINDGNDGQFITNHVQGAFSIGTYRTDLDIYLTVSAEDGCRTGPYAETADYDWPLYAENGSTGSYQANNSPSFQVSGWCAAAPNPSRNVTTNQLLHIHVRDNDTVPPVTSQAKWRADATSGGKVLLPMMAMTVGGASSAPAGWDPTWANLGAQGRVPTHEGQGKALEWQLTDGDVSTYTHPATAGGTGTQAWKGSANPIRLFFNVYDEYLHSGLASFTAYSARPTASGGAPTKTDGAAATGSYISQADKTRSLDNTALQLGGAWNYFATADTEVIAAKTYYTRSGDTYTPAVNPSSTTGLYERKWVAELNWAGYKPAWSKITQFPWEDTGENTHGWGTGPDTVLAWQLDASEANVTNLLAKHDILAALGTGVDAEGAQVAFTNDVKLLAWDNDNNADGDQLAAELAFGRVLFSDDDATPPEMASFTSLGTGTNFTWFGRLGQWTFGDSASAPVFTATPLMPAITLSTEVTLHQYATASDPSRHWNSSSHTIYYDGAGGRATDWNQTGAPYFEFTLKGNGNTVWNADMIGFENRVAQAGPTLYALTVQAPTLSMVNNAVASGAINADQGWTTTGSPTVPSSGNYKGMIDFTSGTEAEVLSAWIPVAEYTTFVISGTAVAHGSVSQTTTRTMDIEYKASGDGGWTLLKHYTVSEFAAAQDRKDFSWDLKDEAPGLLGSAKSVQIRIHVQNAGTTQTYAVDDFKLTYGSGDGREHVLGRMEIEKELDETGGHFKTETVTSVIFGFDTPIQCAKDDTHIFRLYAFDATRYNSDGVLEHLSDMPSSGGWTFTWGIKNLFLHGTATEPKKSEVTDYDVAKGAWTNNLEVLDGAMAGYDTVRSGVRVKDASGEVSGEKPSFRILYPSAYDGAAPNSDPNGVVSGGELILRSVSSATFNHLSDPEFTAGTSPWTLSASGATVSGGKLTLAEGASAYAKQTVALDAMSGVKSATVSGTVRARGTKATDAGGVNKLTVTAKVYSKANVLMKTLTEDIVTTSRAKNYPVGPWVLNYDNVGSVEFTVGQTDATATELVVESLSGYVAQWGADITEADAAWATTVTNGMEAAKVLVRTPELDLTTTSVPLSIEGSGHSQPADQWYKLEATVHDFDGDRAGDALSTSATTNFWLYDDDVLAPQWGAKFDSPMGIFMGGTIISLKARRNSGADQIWPILDSDLTALAPSAEVLFSLSAYDYSGWKTTGFAVGSETVQDGAAVASAAATAGWSQTAAEGAPESPAATNTWSITAKDLYTAHKDDFKASAGVTAELTANTTDLDNDRKDDSLATGSSRVGYAWFADQDVSAPGWGSQTTPYYGLMISTGVGASAGLADLIGTEEAPAPYALGGAANNQGEFAGRSYTVYDGQLKAAGTEGANQFVITANLNDPLPTDAGARARHPTGLKRGSTLTESAAMWGDSSVAANVFTVTNTHLVLQTPWTGGEGSLTNVAFSEAFTDPAIGKTRINTQAGHTSWAWTFPTNDIGKLLPPSETVVALTLKVQAYDADANRHEDQMHAELVGPVITLRDDDTSAPSAPSEVKVNGETVVAGSVTRETAPWTNDLSSIQVAWTASEDGDVVAPDIKKAGVAGYRLASHDEAIGPDAGSALEGTTTNGTTVSKALSGVTMLQGWDTYKLFAVDADADRPGDALPSTAADLPLAYDITKPTEVAPNGSATGSGNRLVADPETTDDPTTQFDLTWPIGGIGPDDPNDTDHYNAIPDTVKAKKVSDQEILSPWYSYKIYYTNFEESAVTDDNPSSKEGSWVYRTFINDPTAPNYYKNWAFVMTNSPVQDPSAPKDAKTGRSTAYDSLGQVKETVSGSGKQKVRLYDLDFDNHYVVIIVGVDKAGNEGPAGMWSWATNNTIKFAVTQGVIRARADINTLVGVASGTNTVGMAPIPEGGADKAAVLYWMAAGMKNGAGNVNKLYDLIYRDASSFNETGTEQWNMASTAGNSGTSKTNWNYQADAGLATPGRLRFYRASYTGRWQDTKPGTSEKQYPLASEEVYSMNNIILSEGWNYVSLQGVPWTNTFRGVFGTDREVWPPDATEPTSTNGAVVVEFYQPGTNTMIKEQYFFASDGEWYNATNTTTPVTDKLQAPDFFTRPFSINLPSSTMTVNGETKEVEWWKTHNDNKDNALGARYGSRTNLMAMIWHPILQVPTNGVVEVSSASTSSATPGSRDGAASARVFKQTIHRAMNGTNVYNTLSLNLPVSVNPSNLCLVAFDEETGKPTTVPADMKMKTGIPQLADKLYVVDSKTKEVRGNSTMYCDADGVWRYNSNKTPVTGNVIKPNDMLILISVSGSGTWEWTYSPEDFYEPPNRHMGRDRL